jgi:hypothetical protein
MRLKILLILSLALSPMSAGPALAHKLLISATPQGEGVLLIEAFFPDGAPAQQAPVTVTPQGGEAIIGKTDAKGAWRLTGLKPGPHLVVVGDEMGHRAEKKVVMPGAAEAQPQTSTPAQPPPASAAKPPVAAPAETGSRAEPIPWTNILAGLGFVFGLTAFLMVLKLKAELKRHASGH